MSDRDRYQTPLVTRYASARMSELFGERHRVRLWRRIWLALAEAQHHAGLNVSEAQIGELASTLETIDFAAAARHEKRFRHDVMAHVHAWGDIAPTARGILHLGATSADVTDNADLVILRDALRLIAEDLAATIDALGAFAQAHRDLPTLGYTHFQPAQVTTVGKRATLWCYDFVRDLEEVERLLGDLRFRGLKGAAGTQASFLALFHGRADNVLELERDVARRLGFDRVEPVTGQTYSRKVDAQIVCALAGIAASVHKFANDVRLLQNLRELEEPFEEEQIGSSAMPYKRNPVRCERATALARFVLSLAHSPLQTAAEQWLERTLDDSANRRIVLAEAFLAADGMLRLVVDVARGLVVHRPVIEARLQAELPYVIAENVLMAAAARGGDRQDLHERLRRHARDAEQRVKLNLPNDLLERLRADPAFSGLDGDALTGGDSLMGLAPRQVDEFLGQYVAPIRARYEAHRHQKVELDV